MISVNALVGDLLLELGDLGHVRLEVGAREERLPHARDDRDPGLVVGREALPRLAQELEVLHVGRVAGLGAVDRDHDHMVCVLLVVNGHRRRVTLGADLVQPDARVHVTREDEA